ncbi:MAG TPA: FtsX-like permease family protein [Bryobacteraceae bacterium]
MREEIEGHLARLTTENLRAGLSPKEARRQAALKFGAAEAIKEDYRDQQGLPFLETLFRDMRYGSRQLRNHPGLTITVLLTLGLGTGANTAIFTVDYATLLAPLPYPDAGQLVMVWSKIRGHRNAISTADFLDWKRQNDVFQDLNAQTEGSFNVATRDQPENMQGRITTPGLYRMLGYPFFFGRDFLPEEGQPGGDHVIILTHKLWERLGSDPRVLGTTMQLNGELYKVVGVFAAGLTDRGQGEFAVPLAFNLSQLNRDTRWLDVMGRLKPGITIKQAQSAMEAVAARLAETYPKSNRGWGASVEPLKNDFIPSQRIVTLWLLLGAVAFVLLIACVNVANLLLARGMTRQKEMAVRSALGAKSASIFAQLLTESLLFAVGGGALGVMAFSVAQRSHEIASRMALGASRNRALALVLAEGAGLACAGFGLGLVGAYFVGRTMQSALFQIGALEPSVVALVGLVLLFAALLACYLPGRRAASLEPIQALRQQ